MPATRPKEAEMTLFQYQPTKEFNMARSTFLASLGLLGFFCIALPAAPTHAATVRKIIPVWPKLNVPRKWQNANNNEWPTLTVMLAPHPNGTAVVICPGGAYAYEVMGGEGYAPGQWMNSLGVSAFVLKYRLPLRRLPKNGVPLPLQDVRRAVQILRANARKWKINPHRIGVMGFSAGGHLAAMAGTHFLPGNPRASDPLNRFSTRPDFLVLCYPVISMMPGLTHPQSHYELLGHKASLELDRYYSNELTVCRLTPPTFICCAADDNVVNPLNSIDFYKALKQVHVPVKFVEFKHGQHGFSMGRGGTDSIQWPADCKAWLQKMKFLPPAAQAGK